MIGVKTRETEMESHQLLIIVKISDWTLFFSINVSQTPRSPVANRVITACHNYN